MDIVKPSRAGGRRTALFIVAALALTIVGAALYCRAIGYPSGPIYTMVPATAAPSAPNRGTVAVFLSGDMGFNIEMGPRIAERLAVQGIPVLGVNSLTAFAHRRTPRQVGALVRDATLRALRIPGARRVVLIGQSFGANALLAGIGDLPPGLRARVPIVELIVPGETMLYRATPGGIFDSGSDGPALPTARRLNWAPVLCIYGETEHGSLCPLWSQPNVTRVTLPGDHFLHEDAALITATLVRQITLHAGG